MGLNHRTNICEVRPGLIFHGVPKAANTSVKVALLIAQGRGHLRPHDPSTFREMSPAECLQAIADGAFVFTFTRHPYDRFRSAWRDLIRNDRWVHVWGMRRYRNQLNKSMSPECFARFVSSVPDKEADNHFRSQTALLHKAGAPLFTMAGRVETLDADWDRVQRVVSDRFNLTLPSLPVHNATDGRAPLNRATRKLLRERYATDFETFGY